MRVFGTPLFALLLAAAGADAQFTAPVGSPFGVGLAPRSVAVADFNGDGKADLAAANSGGNSVTVLLSNGSGFTAPTGSPFAVGSNPQSVATADFNGDGIPDLVTANSGGNNVTVLLGTGLLGSGSGRFTPTPNSPIAVGASPIFAAVGDFNGDGKFDIVTANSGDNTLTVLLGDGLGGFTEALGSPIMAGTNPQSIAIGDLNKDGNPDIAVANYGDNTVTVLLGNGSGGFTEATGSPFGVGLSPVSLALGDLNGDGALDIFAANFGDNTVTALLGDGTGGFTAAPASPFAVGLKPCSVALADFNGDGVPDLAIADSGNNTVTVLFGNGMGGLTGATGSPFAVGSKPCSVAVGDFNGDGMPDIAAADSGASNVTVLLNSLSAITVEFSSLNFYAAMGQAAPTVIPVSVSSPGAGSTYTVSSNQPWLVPNPPSNATGASAVVHLSANPASLPPGVYAGTVRYTAPNFFDAATTVTLNLAAPSGTLKAANQSPFAVGAGPQSAAVGDFNGDGAPDLATANSADNTVTVLLGDGAGGFSASPGSPFAVGMDPTSVAAADLNGDGIPDLVTANTAGNNVTILLGDGAGGFTTANGSPFAVGSGPDSIAVADFNGDGVPDLVTANYNDHNLTVLLGDGAGGFTPAPHSPFAVGSNPRSVAVADLNGDGNPDLVTVTAANAVTILLGSGSGAFTVIGAAPVGFFPQSVAVADVNGDGKPDIATANSGSNSVTVLLGNGSGGFSAAPGSPFAVGIDPQAVAIVDVNGDGRPDLVTANLGDNTVSVLLGNGPGGFSAASGSPFAAGIDPQSVVAADFHGDGRADIAIADAAGNVVTVLLGMAAATNSVLTTAGGLTVAYGIPVPLTLKVTLPSGGFSAPAGPATFLDNSLVIGNAVQTAAPYTFSATGLAAGNHELVAVYGGNSANASSSSNTVSITVTPGNQTIAFGTLINEPFGTAPVMLAATASSGLAVAFASTTPAVCTVAESTVTLQSVGTCAIQASQPGNADYAAAPNAAQSFLVSQGTQTIAFPALPNVADGTAPLMAVATASSGLPVSFASTTASVCTVSGATVTLVSVGSCTIQAAQAGNVDYLAAALVSQHFSVTAQIQTITFAALSSQTFGSAPFAVAATASSGLAVAFASTTAPVCTVSGATVTLTGAGTCTIKASQAGNSSFAAAPAVEQSFAVGPGSQTITFAALPDKAYGSAAFTVSATASSRAAVSFASTTPSTCTVAGAAVTLAGAGTCTIEASQSGTVNYAAAMPVNQSFTVTPGAQTIAFGALAGKVLGSAPFAVTATASSGLTVVFSSTTPTVCAVAVATVTLILAGTCTIEADQPGSANYAAAMPVDQNVVVTQGSQTIKFGVLSNQALGTAPFMVSATATSGLPVSFAAGNLAVCTVAGSTVTLVSAGTCTIQAFQAGNANYAAAPSVSQHFTVTPGSQTIAFAALKDQTFGTPPFTIAATASSGLTVTFASTGLPVCTVTGETVTLVSVGVCTIQALQAGNADYAAATPVVQTFTVYLGAVAIQSIVNAGSYAAEPIAVDGYTAAFGSNFSTVTAQSKTPLPTTLAGAEITIVDANGTVRAASLYYVSPTQINFVVPEGLTTGIATVTAANLSGNTGAFATAITQVSPSLFSADSTGAGVAAATAVAYVHGASPKVLTVFNCTGSPPVCTAVPIDLGTPTTSVYLVLFGTGIRGRDSLAGVSVTLGGTALDVTYAAAQSTYPGLDQVNVLLDRSLIGKGLLPLQLTVDGVAANPVTVSIE
ncbi:MAG: FG-GAP-like repeat-containing protein [Bryobacteraceae bacterium]